MDYYLYDYDDDSNSYEDEIGGNIDEQFIVQSTTQFSDILINCIYPSISQITSYVATFLFWNFVFRCTCQLAYKSELTKHLLSIITGCIILIYTIGPNFIYLITFGIISYILLLIFVNVYNIRNRLGITICCICITGLAAGELIQNDRKLWHQIRGIQMVAAMKIISIAFDIESKKIGKTPTFMEFFGYLLCPANAVLGPWIPFEEHLTIFKQFKLNISWIFGMLLTSMLSVLFLILSNCIVSTIISDHSWKWFIAYRDALAFRCSHYFISYLSQATMIASGCISSQQSNSSSNTGGSNNQRANSLLGYQVTKPWAIEFPRSLVQVVINWNIPMHYWLKTYIFRNIKPYSIVVAIFTTYLISSLLHGLNFQLGIVLLSFGFYTYVEYSLRTKIATAFNACVLATSCKRNCSHTYKWNNSLVLLTNIVFSISAIGHLAYLGVVFEEAFSSNQEEGFSIWHTFSKWETLGFTSHWIVLVCYIFYVLI